MSLPRGWVLAVLLCLVWEASGDASARAFSDRKKCKGSIGNISARNGEIVRKDLGEVAHSINIFKLDRGCAITLYANQGSNGERK